MAGQSLKDRPGDFTIYRFVKNMPRDVLEKKLGFERGLLADGAILAQMDRESLSGLTIADFSLGASTRWSRSSAAAPWAPDYVKHSDGTMAHDAIEARLRSRGEDVDALKSKVLKYFQTASDGVPAKVFPKRKGEHYPNADGGGVPQFKLLVPKGWTAVKEFK
jgi:hypothetical protein